MEADNDNKRYSAYFCKMYGANEMIKQIGERVDKLYELATKVSPANDGMPKAPNPGRLADTICEMADLRAFAENLLKQRARFDLFAVQLDPDDRLLLDLKFKEGNSWKRVAAALDVSINTARRAYNLICRKADKACLIEYNNDRDGGEGANQDVNE